jgi:hypothetical protein
MSAHFSGAIVLDRAVVFAASHYVAPDETAADEIVARLGSVVRSLVAG